ncbi:hypothetical protein Pint_10904 [Pistacia integerrima]|uniref:Uncharacterized protein n=1 Tax=Pistacia integerrima TaxID=434235 RepID=A0ACC0XK59_9ROSI|nr:hypothetical protein Pint_10904 [Pistacia integerrima]
MGTKMKGIYKSFKYISQIFVVKEREMEIGYPTDVKHVAHIGWDGQSGTAPSWMNDFKTAPDFSTSIGNSMDSSNMALSTWSSQGMLIFTLPFLFSTFIYAYYNNRLDRIDFEQSMGGQPASDIFKDIPPTDLPNIPKKQKRKKKSSTSSPLCGSSRSSRAAKSRTTYNEMGTANVQV